MFGLESACWGLQTRIERMKNCRALTLLLLVLSRGLFHLLCMCLRFGLSTAHESARHSAALHPEQAATCTLQTEVNSAYGNEG